MGRGRDIKKTTDAIHIPSTTFLKNFYMWQTVVLVLFQFVLQGRHVLEVP